MTAASPFMQAALQEAARAAQQDEVPVGAVIVKDNRIIASAHNLTETENDPTAHAELLAIRAACDALGSARLVECDMYVTLEPCAMCAAAISFARIRRLYYGAADEKGGGVEHGGRFFTQATCHHQPDVYSGIAAQESAALLTDFFKKKR